MANYYALLQQTAGIPIPNSATTTLSWSGAVRDSGNFFRTSQPSRLYVSGAVSLAMVVAQVPFAPDSTGQRGLTIIKGGASFTGQGECFVRAAASGYGTTCLAHTGYVSVVSGDYFEVQGFHTAGATISAIGGGRLWFSIETW